LRDYLRCPYCLTALRDCASELTCPRCERRYPRRGRAVDFLDAATREAFGIVATDNVSDHPFDANALAIIDAATVSGGMVLDCGSGTKSEDFPNVVQMDIVNYPFVDVLAVNQRLPFEEGAFDAVFSLDVLEHVDDPFACAAELARVLRPGGVLYVDMPFLQAEHGHPHHYFNATRMGLQRLFRDLLEVEAHHVPMSGHPFIALHDLIALYDQHWRSEPARARYRALTIEEILSRDKIEWLDDVVATGRTEESLWITASATQALMRKPTADPPGELSSALPVTAEVLPGFPLFDARRRQALGERASRSQREAQPETSQPSAAPVPEGLSNRLRRRLLQRGP
jgi:SAM-dependent methyltransferase